MDDKKDPNWWKRIPVPNLCEWQIMKKIAQNDGKLTRYFLADFTKTCGECDETKMSEYKVNKLLRGWDEEHGLIELKPAYWESPILLTSMTSKGKEYMDILSRFFDAIPPT